MTVDDDPGVLAAIERDLRRQYRRDYRIVRASSGAEALDAARELKERGQGVALFLSDERMPGMTGTELLVELRKLYPESRRVLLTAYSDTEAAIKGINDVGLDYYLLKPWDPPERELYPLLDDLLADWAANVRAPYEGIRVAGARWSAPSFEIKDFLSRNHVPYQWIDIEQDPAARALVADVTGDTNTLPVVFFPDGEPLVAPTKQDLAVRVGMQTQAKLPFYDLAIIGAGPAGLAAAVYGASEGLHTVLIEQNAPGGQAGTSSQIENYLGFPAGVTGADLARRAVTQALRFGAELLTTQEIAGIRRDDPYRVLVCADGTEIACKAVVLATGVAVRTLEADGVDDLTGTGVYYGAAMTEAASYRDQDVGIVGGANSAGQGALFFSRYASRVRMLVRAADLRTSMSQYLVDRIEATPNIDVVNRVELVQVHGDHKLDQAILRNVDTDEKLELDVAALFVFIGATPRTDMVADLVQLDDKGYVLTGPDLLSDGKRPRGWALDRDPFLFETSVPGIFAVGDLRSGSGKRVAAAVGEGSATVNMVHRYLDTV
jgi:thioredoxin reductase (NADPH)